MIGLGFRVIWLEQGPHSTVTWVPCFSLQHCTVTQMLGTFFAPFKKKIKWSVRWTGYRKYELLQLMTSSVPVIKEIKKVPQQEFNYECELCNLSDTAKSVLQRETGFLSAEIKKNVRWGHQKIFFFLNYWNRKNFVAHSERIRRINLWSMTHLRVEIMFESHNCRDKCFSTHLHPVALWRNTSVDSVEMQRVSQKCALTLNQGPGERVVK